MTIPFLEPGLIAVSVVGFLIFVVVGPFRMGIATPIPVYLFVQTEEAKEPNKPSVSISINDETPNYVCKVGDIKNIKCTISEPLENDNNHLQIWELMKDKIAAKTLTDKISTQNTQSNTTDLQSNNKIYKIKLSQEDFLLIKENTKIKVLENKNDKQYIDSRILFSMYGNESIGETEYFVGKSEDSSSTKLDKCFFNNESTTQQCQIFDFGYEPKPETESGYFGVKFIHSDNESTSIVANKHYLIKLTLKEQVKGFQKTIKASSNPIVKFKYAHPAFLVDKKLLVVEKNLSIFDFAD